MIRTAIGLGLTLWSTSPALADVYLMDPNHTVIEFTWNHNDLANMSGRFTSFSGTFDLDFENVENSIVSFTIPVSSIWTGVQGLDTDMVSARLFNAEQFPTIEFVSTGARQTGLDRGELYGDLTIRGITHPVTLFLTVNYQGDHPFAGSSDPYAGALAAGISAEARINRSDFRMGLGVPWVSDEIQIRIDMELANFPDNTPPDNWVTE